MKTIITNIIISHVAFLSFFGGVALAFAQEQEAPTPPPPNEQMKQQTQASEPVVLNEESDIPRIQQVENRITQQTELSARSQERIINLAANMSNRIDAVTVRLQNIADRVASRIEKMEGGDVDIQTAVSALASAQLSLDTAKTAMTSIDADVTMAVSTVDARSAWRSVKNNYSSVRDQLKTAHAEITMSVEALKTPRVISPTTPEESNDLGSNDGAIIVE